MIAVTLLTSVAEVTSNIIPPEKPIPPKPPFSSEAYAVMKVDDDGYVNVLMEYSFMNKKDVPIKEIRITIPYKSVNFWYAKQQMYATKVVLGKKCPRCGKFFNESAYQLAKEKAGYASSSGIDVDERQFGGLVFASIKYPLNRTNYAHKYELVCAQDYKKLVLSFDGWNNVPMREQHTIIPLATSQVNQEFIDKEIRYEVNAKQNLTDVVLIPYREVNPEESTSIQMRFKIDDKAVTEVLYRQSNFALKVVVPSGVFNLVVSVMLPKHDIFRLTKPSTDLEEIKPYYGAEKQFVQMGPGASIGASIPASKLSEMAREATRLEKILAEEAIQTRVEKPMEYYPPSPPNKVYRIIFANVPPNEIVSIEGYYAIKTKFYGIPASIGVIVFTIIALAFAGRIKKYLF